MNAQAWDSRLIAPERARELAADWPLIPAARGGFTYLDCGRCGQAVMPLRARGITPDGITSAVVRHAVTHHDQSLSGGAHGGSGGAGSAGEEAGGPDPARHDRGSGHPGDRPGNQEAGPGRSDATEGGDQQ